MAISLPHPLSALSLEETNLARDIILKCHADAVLKFRLIWLFEPPKADVVKFLDSEHSGMLTDATPRPQRLAQLRYDKIDGKKQVEFHESIVDVHAKKCISDEVVSTKLQAGLIM